MSIDEYCFNDTNYPEVDEMLTETIDKITSFIKNEVKDDIDSQLRKAEIKQKEIDELKSKIRRLEEIIKNQNNKNNELTAELQKKRTEIPSFEFEIGDKVWVPTIYKTEKLLCKTCEGTGTISVNSEEFGSIEATCSICRGWNWTNSDKPPKQSNYYIYESTYCVLKTIEMVVTASGIHYTYQVKTPMDSEIETEVFFLTKRECDARCREITQESFNSAVSMMKKGYIERG